MANTKISALTSATTPLAGTETLPVVQSGATKQVSVANLTAGRSISASGVTVTGLTASKPVFTDGSSNLTSSGTVPTNQGGTGLTSFTANGVVYASSTSAIATGAVLTFDGTNFAVGAAPGSAKGLIVGLDQTTANVDTAGNIDFEISSTGTSVSSGGSLIFSAASGAWKFAAIKALATNGGGNSQGSLSISVRRNATDATLTESIRFHPSGGISIDSGTDPSAGNVLLGTGNLVQGTAAKGINFTANTPAAGMTSQLLNWYEEGTWTVTLYDAASGGTASVITWTGYYTRIGRQVTATFSSTNGIDTTGMSPTGPITVSLPFTASATGAGVGSLITRNISFTGYDYVVPYVANSAARASIRKVVSGGTDVIMPVSDLTSGTARLFYFTLTYFV